MHKHPAFKCRASFTHPSGMTLHQANDEPDDSLNRELHRAAIVFPIPCCVGDGDEPKLMSDQECGLEL